MDKRFPTSPRSVTIEAVVNGKTRTLVLLRRVGLGITARTQDDGPEGVHFIREQDVCSESVETFRQFPS